MKYNCDDFPTFILVFVTFSIRNDKTMLLSICGFSADGSMEEFWGKGGEGARDVTYNRVP
jgi:hypothetical protein